jgi:hypothetical protein
MKRKRLIGPTDARGGSRGPIGDSRPVRAYLLRSLVLRLLSVHLLERAPLYYTRCLAPPGAGRSTPCGARTRWAPPRPRAIPRGPRRSGARRAPLAPPPPSTSGLASSASPRDSSRAGSRDGPGASGAPRSSRASPRAARGRSPRAAAPRRARATRTRTPPPARPRETATRRPPPPRRRRSAANRAGGGPPPTPPPKKGTRRRRRAPAPAATDGARAVAETANAETPRRDRAVEPEPSPRALALLALLAHLARLILLLLRAPLRARCPSGSTNRARPLANTPSRAGASSGSSPKRRTRRDEDADIISETKRAA